MAITRYQTDAQYDDYGADEEYLRDVISQASAPKVALFGDSISAAVGYGKDSQKDTKYGSTVADILSDYLGTSVDSQAKGGLTTKDALSGQGLPSGKTFEEYLQTNKPNVVILRYGAADAIRLNDPDQTLSNLQTMVNLAKEYGAKPILVGVSPFAAGNDIRAGNINEWSVDPYINSANTINAGIQQLAQQNSLPFVDMQKLEVPKGALLDGVHPTADFGKAMADYIGQSVKTALPEFGGSFEQYQNFTSSPAVDSSKASTDVVTFEAFDPLTFDWTKGPQTVGGYAYTPVFYETGSGENQLTDYGQLLGIIRAPVGSKPGDILENIDPVTGQINKWQSEKDRGVLGQIFHDLSGIAADVGPVVQFVPGVGQVVQAINAINAARSGNIAQGIASLAGLGGYTEIANAARIASAIENKDPLAAITAGMNLTGIKDIGGFTAKEITAANTVVQGLRSGNVAQALNGAAQLTNSPNVALAGAAVNFYNAAKAGNPSAMLRAGEALTGAINEQSRYYSKTDTGDEAARLQARYGTADQAADRAATEQLQQSLIYQDANNADTVDTAARLARDAGYTKFTWGGREYGIPSAEPTERDVLDILRADDAALSEKTRSMSVLQIGNDEANTLEEAASLATARGYGSFKFGGGEYTISAPDPTKELERIVLGDKPAGAPAITAQPGAATGAMKAAPEGASEFGALKIEHPNQARAAQIIKEELGDFYLNDPQWSKWFNQGGLNAAAANVFAGTEDNLREQLQGLKAGTNTSISLPSEVLRQQMAAGYDVGDYKPPEGYEIAPGGEVLADIAYTAAGVPVNLAQKVTVTGTRAPTTLGEAASDVMNAVKGTSLEAPMAMAIGAGGELGQAGAGFLTWFANLPKDHSINRTFNEITKAAEQGVPQEVKDSWKNWRDRVGKADGFVGTLKEGVLAAPENWKGLLWETGKEILQEIPTLGMGLAVRGTAMGLALAQKVATRLGIGVATAMEMVENGGAAYNEAVGLSLQKLDPLVKSGKITAEQAAYLSHGAGAEALLTGSAITGALSLIPGGNALIQQIVGRELQSGATNFAQTIVNTAITGAKAAGKEFITEGVEEGGTRAGVEYAATGQVNPQTVAYNAITGAFVGGLTSGSVASVDALQQNLRDAYAGQSDDTVIGKNPQTGQDVTLKQTIDALEARKQEPTFDSSTVVATDPDTGDDITLGDLTGATIRDAEVSTRVEPTLEALEDTDLDSRQIVSDYVSEVLGGEPTVVEGAQNNGTVLSLDPETGSALVVDSSGNTQIVEVGKDVTVGDTVSLGPIRTDDATSPVVTDAAPGVTPRDTGISEESPDTAVDVPVSAPAPDDVTTAPNTGTVLAVDPESGEALVIDSSGNTNVVTVGPDVREGQVIDLGVAEQPAAQPVADVAATPRVDAATGATSQTSTDPATNTTTVNVVDPSSNTTTTTVTNNNTGVESSTRVDANNNTTTEVVVDPTAGTQTETTTDNNTGTTTQTTTDTTTGVTTDTTTNVAPDTTTGVTSDTATDVQPEVVTDVTTTPDTATEVVTQPETQVTPETTTQPEVVAEPETTVEPDTTVQPEIDTTPELRQGSITDPDTGDVFMVTIDRQGNIIEVLDYIPFTGDVGTEPIFDENFPVDFAPEPDVTTEPGITPEPDVTPEPDITTQPVTDTSPEPPELPIDTDLPPMTEEDLLDIVQPPVVPPDQTTVPPAQPPVAQPPVAQPPVAQPPVGAPPAGPPPAAPGTPAQTQQQKLQALLQSIQGQPQQWQVAPPILAGEFTPQYNPYLFGRQPQQPSQDQSFEDLMRMLGYNQ